MAKDGVSPWPAIAGFGGVSGAMLASLAVLLLRAPPTLPWAGEEAVVVMDDRAALPRVYVPLTHALTIKLREGGPRMEAGLALAVRGSTEDLLALTSRVEAQIAPIEAEVVRAAQEVVAESTDSRSLHAALPARLRDVINNAIATDDWPTPVDEVLITALRVY